MLDLHLLRHAKTEKTSTSGNDFDRKLTHTGIIQANVLRTKLEAIELNPDQLFISSSKRTQQTTEIILSSINFAKRRDNRIFYLAETEQILNELRSVSDQSVMLIGHNEGLSDLATFLTGETTYLRPCDYVHIQLPVSTWEQISYGIGSTLSFLHQDVILPSE